MCKRDRWHCAALGADNFFEPEECCWRRWTYPVAGNWNKNKWICTIWSRCLLKLGKLYDKLKNTVWLLSLRWTLTTETYLSTHCEHNLAINSSPAFLCCHCDNVSAPVTLPGQAPEFKVDFYLFRMFFFLWKIANAFLLHTLLVLTGSLFSEAEVLHWPQHLLILLSRCFSILQDQRWPGVWGEAVGYGLESTYGWICCGRWDAEKHVLIVVSMWKPLMYIQVLHDSLPNELAGSVTQGPKHVEIQLPHVCLLIKKSRGQADSKTLVLARAPVTSDRLNPVRKRARETAVQLIY